MAKNCIHEEYKISPNFLGPRYEKKHVRLEV